MHSYSPHLCYILCPSHTVWLYNSNYTWRTAHFMMLLVMHFLRTSRHLSFLGPNILRTLFSNTLYVLSSLNIIDEFRTTGKIIVLCILFFTFLDSRRKAKGSELNGSITRNQSPLNSSWIKFWFLTVVHFLFHLSCVRVALLLNFPPKLTNTRFNLVPWSRTLGLHLNTPTHVFTTSSLITHKGNVTFTLSAYEYRKCAGNRIR
jgi:hypothetical protein